jgi:hypothetical protein
MTKKKVTFEPAGENTLRMLVDGVEVNTGYENQKGTMLKREFGLTALLDADIEDPEALEEYTTYPSRELLEDRAYVRRANNYYNSDNVTIESQSAASDITYGKYKKLIEAGYTSTISFIMAYAHECRFHIERHGELDELNQILNS